LRQRRRAREHDGGDAENGSFDHDVTPL
jgi:hypothetical protein